MDSKLADALEKSAKALELHTYLLSNGLRGIAAILRDAHSDVGNSFIESITDTQSLVPSMDDFETIDTVQLPPLSAEQKIQAFRDMLSYTTLTPSNTVDAMQIIQEKKKEIADREAELRKKADAISASMKEDSDREKSQQIRESKTTVEEEKSEPLQIVVDEAEEVEVVETPSTADDIVNSFLNVIDGGSSDDILIPRRRGNARVIRVKPYCNWTTSTGLCQEWNKMSENNNGMWKNMQLTSDDDDIDFYVVINSAPENSKLDKKKTVVFHMEPLIPRRPNIWGEWAQPDPREFLKVFPATTRDQINVIWKLSWSYEKLMTQSISNKIDSLSVIMSDKMAIHPGLSKQLEFAKHLEERKVHLYVYGTCKGFQNHHGALNANATDEGLFPYKYHYTAECFADKSVGHFYSHKIWDAIMAECLCFYHGPPGLEQYIDSRCFIRLDHKDYNADMLTIQRAIASREWESRIDVIRSEKNRILNSVQFFPRLYKTLLESQK